MTKSLNKLQCPFCNSKLYYFIESSQSLYLRQFNYKCDCEFNYKCYFVLDKNKNPSLLKIYSYIIGKFKISYFCHERVHFIYSVVENSNEASTLLSYLRNVNEIYFKSVEEIENFLLIC